MGFHRVRHSILQRSRKTITSVYNSTVVLVWLFLPESPRWLVKKGKVDQARKVLLRVNGRVESYDVDHELAVLSTEVIESARLSAEASEISIFDVFRGTNRVSLSCDRVRDMILNLAKRRLFISFFPFAMQQWIGNTLVQTYSSYFFQLAGLKDPFNGTVATLCRSCLQVQDPHSSSLAIAVATNILTLTVLIEKVGRRRLLLVGGSVCFTCLFLVSIILRTVPDALHSSKIGSGLIALCCVWQASNAGSFGPAGYIYLGETSTVLLRAKTTGVAAAGTGFLNLIINFCTPLMLSSPHFGVWATGE